MGDYKGKIPFNLVDNQKILIMPLGDIHFGSRGFPLERFKTHLEWGMERGAYFLGMGEYLDFAAHSQRGLMGQLRDSTKEILDKMILDQTEEFLKIVKSTKSRWIGLLEGDHRWDFADGTSVDQRICKAVDAPFLGSAGLIRLKMHKHPKDHPEADVIIYCHHGIGSSRTEGGHLHRLSDLLKFIEADVYLMGHSHAKIAAPIDRQMITPDGIHSHRTKLIARTGSWFLNYYSTGPFRLEEPAFKSRGNYPELKSYPPSSLGGIAIGIGFEQIEKSKYYRPMIHISL
jgi:hypothetical protein